MMGIQWARAFVPTSKATLWRDMNRMVSNQARKINRNDRHKRGYKVLVPHFSGRFPNITFTGYDVEQADIGSVGSVYADVYLASGEKIRTKYENAYVLILKGE